MLTNVFTPCPIAICHRVLFRTHHSDICIWFYSATGFLLKVETYTNSWQTQAEMLYDGLGNRLRMTAAGLTTQYELDGGRVLSANAAGNVTHYLYGLGPIGELTTAWAYSLPDGGNTPRQLVDSHGEVTFAASYTPWGDTLETYGTGRFTQGYFGGIMDTVNSGTKSPQKRGLKCPLFRGVNVQWNLLTLVRESPGRNRWLGVL